MRSRGFAGTSVQAVCHEAGVTKGSFFHHFGSKEDLACAVAERYGRNRRAAMAAIPALRMRNPRDRMIGFVDAFIVHAGDPGLAEGCLLGSLGQEVARSHPAIRRIVDEAFEAWADQLEAILREAQRVYAPASSWEPRAVARHFIAVFEGALILAKSGRGPEALRESLDHYKRYLLALLPRDGVARRRPE